ncbi:MAG: FHA domain-containing protein [Candidatus Aminicenantes bacterium]|nr:FHA domain-containing protein [Candidatus Aminicenantes bacterium]
MTQSNVPASVAARLVGRNGEYLGNEFFIKGDDFLIGRAFECHLMLNDEMISSQHARIVRSGEHYELQDLGSTNGTFVNGEKIAKKVLRTGDKLMFGALEFEFSRPLDVSRTMVATPEAMAELAKAKAHAIPAAAPAPAPAAAMEVVKIPKAAPGHPLAGLIPGVLMGLLIAYIVPLLAAAFQLNKLGNLTVTGVGQFLKSWAGTFPGMHTHVGLASFDLSNMTSLIALIGLALGPFVGGFLARRLGRRGQIGTALAFAISYAVVALIIQIAVFKAAFSDLPLSYPGIVRSLGPWGNFVVVLAYFVGVVFVISLIGGLFGRSRKSD